MIISHENKSEGILGPEYSAEKSILDLSTEKINQFSFFFDRVDTCRLTLKTIQDLDLLCPSISNFFPVPEKTIFGLREIILNGIEHGNLCIGYDQKKSLIKNGLWRQEVERRQKLPENAEKSVILTITRKDGGVYAIIEDQGKGFDWRKYIHVDPSRASDRHGRGIAQARAISFEKLSYNEEGNRAVAFVSNKENFNW